MFGANQAAIIAEAGVANPTLTMSATRGSSRPFVTLSR